MRIAEVRTTTAGSTTTRAATLSWSADSFELTVAGPTAVIDDSDDTSAFLCVALPLAMTIGGALEVAGPVSARMLAHVDDLQAAYHAWNPEWSLVEVKGETGDARPLAGTTTERDCASFFSRGLDSLYTATAEHDGTLVFVDGLEPRHDRAVRRDEIRLAREAAQRLDRQLVVVETNVRTVTDRFGIDWEDVLGAGLAFVAHNLCRAFEAVTIPSSDSFETVEPCGSSPMLDPLMSTERVEIVHGSISRGRLGKVRWLAEHHPDLMGLLKVCFAENRSDNCGRCGKCLHTMACLHVTGLLERASQFPDRVDVERVRALRLPHLKARIDWADVARSTDGELRSAILEALESSTVASQHEAGIDRWVRRRWTRDDRLELMLDLAIEGRPFPPLEDRPVRPTGLLEVLEDDRPTYRLGSLPHPGEVHELGHLVRRPLPGAVPVWLTDDGSLVARGMTPGPRASWTARLRWTLAPARGSGPLRHRIVSAFRRGRAVRSGKCFAPGRATAGPPTGYLHLRPAPDRVPLYAGWHRVLPAVVLGTDEQEVRGKGGRDALVLGYLDRVTLR